MDVEAAYEKLNEECLIYHGSEISKYQLENALGVKYLKDDWRWKCPLLALQGYLKDEGFFNTAKGLKGALRIYEKKEVSQNVKNTLQSIKRKEKRLDSGMKKIDISDLKDKEMKEFLLTQYIIEINVRRRTMDDI